MGQNFARDPLVTSDVVQLRYRTSGICDSKAENKVVKKVNNLIGKFEKLEAAAELQNQNVQSKSTVRLEKNSAKNILEVDTAVKVGKSKQYYENSILWGYIVSQGTVNIILL